MKNDIKPSWYFICGLICVITGVLFLALDYPALAALAKDHGNIITGIMNIVVGVIGLAGYLGYKLNNNKAQQGVPPLRRTRCAEGER